MNKALIFKVQGYLLIILSVSMTIPLLIAYKHQEASVFAFALSVIATFITGLLMKSINSSSNKFEFQESILVVAGGWLLFCIFGALPYILGAGLNISEAVFETMSGLTTTGATVISNIEALDKGILFWRCFTQWIGGMGIIVLSLAIMPLLGSQGGNLYKAEVPGPTTDKLLPKLQATAKLLWFVYLAITIVQTICLYIAGMNFFDSICHAFTTVASGGFSTKDASIAAYDSLWIHWILIFFMFLAGANFALHFRLITGKVNVYWKDVEFRTYLGIFLFTTIALTPPLIANLDKPPIWAITDSAFQTISILTTTGYISADYTQWPTYSQMLIFLLFFVGGCAGSTSGGVKVIRVLILVRSSLGEIRKLLHPQAVFQLKISRAPVKEEVLAKILAFFVLFIITIFITALCLALTGHNLETSLSAALSCVGNVGPAFAEVGPTDNFAVITDVGKWILVIAMLAGRLELFTILLLFSREYWKHK